jgi:hypothetical protein
MHNRDMIWGTSDGRKIKLIDMTSAHLSNLLPYIEKRKDKYLKYFGEERMKECIYNIKQELRLRKLNRLNSLSDSEDNLFDE